MKFEKIVEEQRLFEVSVGHDFSKMSLKERCAFAKDKGYFVIEETTEMLRELPYHKDWKDYSHLTGSVSAEMLDKARKEWVDAFTFLLGVGLSLDMTADDMLNGYLDKNKINHKRQTEGY